MLLSQALPLKFFRRAFLFPSIAPNAGAAFFWCSTKYAVAHSRSQRDTTAYTATNVRPVVRPEREKVYSDVVLARFGDGVYGEDDGDAFGWCARASACVSIRFWYAFSLLVGLGRCVWCESTAAATRLFFISIFWLIRSTMHIFYSHIRFFYELRLFLIFNTNTIECTTHLLFLAAMLFPLLYRFSHDYSDNDDSFWKTTHGTQTRRLFIHIHT